MNVVIKVNYEKLAKETLQHNLQKYIIANFGERHDPVSPDDAPPCGCCEAWKAYDTLFWWEDDE